MRQARRWWVLGLLLAAVTGPFAAPSIRTLSELEPGQKGIGKTVLKGFELSTFDFELVDILEAEGFATNLLLVKLSGPAIDAIGGIAAGMSGSPLFLGDDLIGAVAFTTPFSDTRYGYATPIEDMLKVFDLGRADEDKQARAPVLALLPAQTPVMVSGLRGRALAAVDRVLHRYGHRAVLSGLPAEAQPPPLVAGAPGGVVSLEAGSAVAASLTTGDVVMTALGTVSYRDGDKLIAFGHPFLQRGATSLFMHPAYIYGVVPSMELPFKVGAPAGPPVGAFVQDRAAGIGGLMRRVADSFELEVEVRDSSLNRKRTLHTQIVDDLELAPTLVAVCVIQCMDEVMDRLGPGTAEMSWEIVADGLDRPLSRRDTVYGATDVVNEAVPGPLFCLDALLRNDFAAVRPRSMKVRVDVGQERHTVRLVALRAEPAKVAPGGTLMVTATLQPYRGKAFEQELSLPVPREAEGNLVLLAHGRPQAVSGPLSQAALLACGLAPPASLADLARALEQTQRGNSLTVELLTPEAAAAREAAVERLSAMATTELFSEEPTALPSLAPDVAGESVLPLSQVEALLEQVVQGRLRRTVVVAGGP